MALDETVVYKEGASGVFGRVTRQSGAGQAAVTIVNANGDIGTLTISAGYVQAEVQALRDACETLADDVRALGVLTNQLRTDLVTLGLIKGGA